MSLRKTVAVLCLFLAACSGRGAGPDATPSEPLPIETTTPEPTITPTEYNGLCSYVWADQPLDELSVQLNQAVRAAGFTQIEAQATAYGENCVDMGSNAVISFTPERTNFFFNVAVSDAADSQALGQWLLIVFKVLEDFPPGIVPGVNPGRVDVGFQDGAHSAAVSLPVARGQALIQQGLRGSALFEAMLREQ